MMDWPQWGIIKVFLAAIAVFVVVRFSRHLLHISVIRNRASAAWLARLFPVIELLIWLAFLVWAFRQIFNEPFYFSVFFIALAFIAMGWLGWYAARDYIAGIILRAQDIYEPGQQIIVGEYKGRIRKLGYLSIELEEDDGTLLKLPYSKLTGQIHYSKKQGSQVTCQSFTLQVPSAKVSHDFLESLAGMILNSPWHVTHRQPQINKGEPAGNETPVDVIVYTYGQESFERLQSELRLKIERIRIDLLS